MIEDGLDLSGKDLYGIRINRQLGEVKEINFAGANLVNANFEETTFINCSFRGANLLGMHYYAYFENCDFTDAIIGGYGGEHVGRTFVVIPKNDIAKTRSYKFKDLSNLSNKGRLKGLDLSGFDLTNSYLDVKDCPLAKSTISKSCLLGMTAQQLQSTNDFHVKELLHIKFYGLDLSKMNFSFFNLTGCIFGTIRNETNISNCDFTDAIISRCNFWNAKNITLSQIKSTWNYKTGNMAGVKLPKELQEQLDKERNEKKGSK